MPFASPLLSMTRWLRRAPRRGRRRRQEPADLGTAFGMEQWLLDEAAAPAPAPSPLLNRGPWWRRWTGPAPAMPAPAAAAAESHAAVAE